MGEKVVVTQSYLQDTADAIREKTGSTDTYKPSEFAAAVRDIQSGGSVETCTVTIEFAGIAEGYGEACEASFVYLSSNGYKQMILEQDSTEFEDVLLNSIMLITIPAGIGSFSGAIITTDAQYKGYLASPGNSVLVFVPDGSNPLITIQ